MVEGQQELVLPSVHCEDEGSEVGTRAGCDLLGAPSPESSLQCFDACPECCRAAMALACGTVPGRCAPAPARGATAPATGGAVPKP